jgi:hypothetical protein
MSATTTLEISIRELSYRESDGRGLASTSSRPLELHRTGRHCLHLQLADGLDQH